MRFVMITWCHGQITQKQPNTHPNNKKLHRKSELAVINARNDKWSHIGCFCYFVEIFEIFESFSSTLSFQHKINELYQNRVKLSPAQLNQLSFFKDSLADKRHPKASLNDGDLKIILHFFILFCLI